MKVTDYAAIAPRYDENEIRHHIPEDPVLAELASRGGVVAALDLACGTGNYLAVQRRAFGEAVRWTGADASDAMLAHARRKNEGVELVVARAEALPFADAAFGYVVSSFAFHHFPDKPRALDEVRRVLAPGGALRVRNVVPARMPRAWCYAGYFPESLVEEDKRYWSPELLHHELELRGFDVTTRVEVTARRVRLADVLVDAERRDASSLAILDEDAYARGLRRIRAELAHDAEARVLDEVALVDLRATRGA